MKETETEQVPHRKSVPLLKRKRFIFVGAIVLIAIAVVAYIGFTKFATYDITVSQFVAQSDSYTGKQVRVVGEVVPGSVNHDSQNFTLSFTMAEGNTILPVVYQGVVPDTFQEGTDIVVEGKSDQQGVFHASQLITKCPSKYEPSS
jgi:cytochrome c-type biogenesis protein CcmE